FWIPNSCSNKNLTSKVILYHRTSVTIIQQETKEIILFNLNPILTTPKSMKNSSIINKSCSPSPDFEILNTEEEIYAKIATKF
ncbi:hypothetical protein BpHYR1_002755, partial [Brachionus plicatilis]